MANEDKFIEEYNKLNKAQKEAVDTIDGPVMVVAGPGTGKTQILSLRIANILKKTDIGSSGILCLTFTNSGVFAMKERLRKYIGAEASKVDVLTFHKFANQIIEQFYNVLGFDTAPKVLEDAESVSICDNILRSKQWEHLRPRNDIGRHFKELKSLVSLLKRERISPDEFLKTIEKEIYDIENNDDNISTRGESKGSLKKEFINKIASLERTKEIVEFYELYEAEKKERNVMDHDDTIRYALDIVENSDESCSDLKEKYQYILIDEHQDSSGAQNSLIKAIWQEEEKPNIFVVGDDRQLIYAFGGANISYFEEFKNMFGKAKVIFLIENYRSTQNILNTADFLLSSSFSDKKLLTNLKENHKLKLVETDYPRDEIIACGLDIKERIKNDKNVDLNNFAILVPKNRQVYSALRVLKDMGIKVASMQNLSLFDTNEFRTILNILKICENSYNAVALGEFLIDPSTNIPILSVHNFLYQKRGKNINLEALLGEQADLFGSDAKIRQWLEKLYNFTLLSREKDVYGLIQIIGDEVLFKNSKDHGQLRERVEIVRTYLHLALTYSEKGKNSLADFIAFIERLIEYGEDIPVATFGSDDGVKVMTLHGSKGLEFDYVWVAHLDEGSVMKGRRNNFTLPESIKNKIEIKDEITAKRELYVAITRAKRFCTLSYSRFSYAGQNQELASIVLDLASVLEKNDSSFEKVSFVETEKKILENDPRTYVVVEKEVISVEILEKLNNLIKKEYLAVNVSVSMLNNFLECPRKWYFRNLLKLPEPKSESLDIGNQVHHAIDRILKLDHAPNKKEIEEIVGEDKEVLKIVLKWVEKRLGEIVKKRENEKSISLSYKDFPHLNIYGKLDLIEFLDSENVRVTDFKTGGVKKKSEIEKIDDDGKMSNYMRQLAMYSFLISKSNKWKANVRESRLEFLEAKDGKEAIYDTFISEEKISLLIKDIKEYDDAVKNGDWSTRECHYNSYGKNTECEYCAMWKNIK